MNHEEIMELLPDYLEGTVEEVQREEIAAHISTCSKCQHEIERYNDLFQSFNSEAQEAPSQILKDSFYKMLEIEKQEVASETLEKPSANRAFPWMSNLVKIAASIALLFGAFTLGKYQQSQVSNVELALLKNTNISIKQMAMLSLMENESASKRIQGVNYVDEFDQPDAAIVDALVDRMRNDDNINVRLTAVEALFRFSNSEKVKDAFIDALKTEKDPAIQMSVIRMLVQIQEKKAVEPMQELMQAQDTQSFVKEHIKNVLPSII